MKQLILSVCFLFSISVGFAGDNDWGQTGHRATAEIAQSYLSKDAKKEIAKLLNGKSLAFVSTFGDEIKSDSEYRKYGPWHYVNLPENATKYIVDDANPDGDLLMGIRKCVEVLKDKSSSKEEKEFYLKMLVHFIGDLHQPLHTGRGEDKGGNDIQVRWFGDGSNLHRVWDSEMIDSYDMSYTEMARNTKVLSKAQTKSIASGTFEDWMYESKKLSERVYASAEVGEKLSYRYMYDWFPVVGEQLQKGGIRLAQVLNEIFD
ncbi:S1/P1 nuclease [Gillisia mitskevichiae]|uniref:S1/P1 nuclease n=1 Tax=Gillisia mitskevichiae TaxID=270921 RepID=A0A495PTA2_9FLAO|nr:S1/P1 nuclease [Gillisia mitskevichiae]RKS53844.1 S1/P1 nuclease [Gillisia mitskevichiae]